MSLYRKAKKALTMLAIVRLVREFLKKDKK